MNTHLVGAIVGSTFALSAAAAFGQVVINTSTVTARSECLTGRAGSGEGPEVQNNTNGGTTGTVTVGSYAEVGPVPAAQPPTPSLPGSTGVVTNRSRGTVVISDVGAGKVIQALCTSYTRMYDLDGGIHLGNGNASFSVNFTVPANTPYKISGHFNPDDQDSTYVRIVGTQFFYFGPVGPYSSSGVLDAGTYTLESSVAVGETAGPGVTFEERSTVKARLVLGNGVPDCSEADVGKQGGIAGADGLLDNNDFVVFITYFFTQDPLADFGKQGGIPGPDSLFDNNDFVVFIDLFFDGCS